MIYLNIVIVDRCYKIPNKFRSKVNSSDFFALSWFHHDLTILVIDNWDDRIFEVFHKLNCANNEFNIIPYRIFNSIKNKTDEWLYWYRPNEPMNEQFKHRLENATFININGEKL